MDHLEKTAIGEGVEFETEVKAMESVEQEVMEEVSEAAEAAKQEVIEEVSEPVEAANQEVTDQEGEPSTVEDKLKSEMGILNEVDLFLPDR